MGRVLVGLGWVLVSAVVAVTLSGCAAMRQEPKTAAAPSVYKQLGGREGIAIIVDDFAANVLADNRINGRFKALQPAQVSKFKSSLADQICDATGGPCAYLGADMKTVHKGMKITDAEWNATVEALTKALDKNNVPVGAKSALLGALAPMKPDIVGQ
jgi:hemoglobin